MRFTRFIFFLLTSLLSALSGYFILDSLLPDHMVFGRYYRMPLYHFETYFGFIIICCLFYTLISTCALKYFCRTANNRRLVIFILILLITFALSSMVGGMYWHYLDMRAGFFPDSWVKKMVFHGVYDGLTYGWIIIALSLPYNILGIPVAYGLLVVACRFFNRVDV